MGRVVGKGSLEVGLKETWRMGDVLMIVWMVV